MKLWPSKKKDASARRSIGGRFVSWMRARFDAAQTTKDNAKHWGAADFLSADAEADSNVRKILRTRARYEVQNNSYARGIVKTLADDTVGTGPRLQMLLDDEAGAAMYTLRSSHVNAVCTPTQLRRLLPVESERLMGFPDGWTDIPWKGKPHAPDGFRHRVCGNSMCVNVMRWVGERIAAVEAGKEFQDYGSVKDRGDNGESPPLAQEGGG